VGTEPSLRQRAHDWSLVFVCALGVYLLSIPLAARIARVLVSALGASASLSLRVLLGALAEGVSRLPWMLLAAVVLASATRLSPRALGAGLPVLCFGLDAAVTAVLGQAPWMLQDPLILGCRLALHALLGVGVALLAARRRRRAG
jgi:hypothetical protein